MSFDLVEIWNHMGMLAKIIAAFLVLMAVASIGVVVERVLAFAKGAKESRNFARQVAARIDNWEIEDVAAIAEKHKASPLARLFSHTINRYLRGFEDLEGGLSPVEMARNESVRRLEEIGSDLRRGMNVLASVGSTAPFVGLLGTVIGIITAFNALGASSTAGINTVMIGISEALAETALGLLVAIPAVLLFNYLSSRVALIELALARSVGELLDEMENRYGRKSERKQKQAVAA
jgi:biopolymer transport protein ExbB